MAILDLNKTPSQKFINSIYKLLPIYEGRILNTTEILSTSESYNNFQKNINMICMQLMGKLRLEEYNEKTEKILMLLEGLKSVGINNHATVKHIIFTCVNLAKTIER